MLAPNHFARPVLVLLALGASGLACAAPRATTSPAETEPKTLAAPPTIPEDGPMDDESRFELHILQGTWASLRLGYDFEPAWTLLRDGYRTTSAFSLSEGDVEAYDWEEQVMTFSPQSSQTLVSEFARTEEERAHPEAALDQRAFVVVLDGSPVYGGIFLHPMSSMGIYLPVIYVASVEGKLTFTLRPIQSVMGDYSAYEPGWQGIKNPGIREVFAGAGVLSP